MSGEGFREALRTLSLSDGFALVPVEVSGPDVARALAAWLDERGRSCRVIEPLDDDAWGDVVAELFVAASTDASVVMLIGARQPPPGIYAAMRLINQRRDSIARKLSRPLLWCGPPDLMKLTWERAPDFWSIRALPLRVEDDAKRASLPPLWPATWVPDPPERLRETLDAAVRHGDAKNAARVACALAEALVARNKIDDAIEVLGEVESTPEIVLARAVAEARRGNTAKAEAVLASSGAPELEARRRMALANVRRARDRAAAATEYEESGALFAKMGDRANEALAIANLGVVALASGDVDEATARLEDALSTLRERGDDRSEAEVRTRLGGAFLAQRDSRRASECFEEALVAFRHLADSRGECAALRHVARAYLNLGDAEKARDDAERAVTLSRALRDEDAEREATALRDEALAELA